jgi:hypothetical protein
MTALFKSPLVGVLLVSTVAFGANASEIGTTATQPYPVAGTEMAQMPSAGPKLSSGNAIPAEHVRQASGWNQNPGYAPYARGMYGPKLN